jgi:hypothetical protein
VDRQHSPGRQFTRERFHQEPEVTVAAGEAGDIPRQCPRRRQLRRVKHAIGRLPADGRLDELGTVLTGEAKRVGQELGRTHPGWREIPALQVRDGPRAQAGRARQPSLRQSSPQPQMPEQLGEQHLDVNSMRADRRLMRQSCYLAAGAAALRLPDT